MHDRFQFMESIRAPAEDVQQQIDFAGRFFLNGLAHQKKALEMFRGLQVTRKFNKAVLAVEAEKSDRAGKGEFVTTRTRAGGFFAVSNRRDFYVTSPPLM
jgi:hypothetical protein